MGPRVDDVEAAKQVKLVSAIGGWPEEALQKMLHHVYVTGTQYDSSPTAIPMESAVAWLEQTAEYSVLLGSGGAGIYYPIQEGTAAEAHIHIWDPQWYGRAPVFKRLNKWAMDKWDLLRLTAHIPSRNRLANKLAQDLGFQLEGRLRQAVRYNEGVDDLMVYGLLREEV